MFSVTCSACGNEARVPFQPRGDKPVYCSDCFSKQRSSGGAGYGGRSYRGEAVSGLQVSRSADWASREA